MAIFICNKGNETYRNSEILDLITWIQFWIRKRERHPTMLEVDIAFCPSRFH